MDTVVVRAGDLIKSRPFRQRNPTYPLLKKGIEWDETLGNG